MLDLDRDPVPGDPYEVKELARKLGDFADDVSSALRSVRGLGGNNAVQDWAGLAADEYRKQFGDLPGELDKLERSYRLASGALGTYWPKLETAQADADRALARGRTARQDLDAAKTTQTNTSDWVKRAGDKSKEYRADPKPGVAPPSADEVRTATRNALDATNAQNSANSAVHDAQQRLDAAKELAAQAAHLRDTAASTAEHALHEASDAGIRNKTWWEKVVEWVVDHWGDIVAICKVIVAVLGVIVMIIGGPLAWIVLAAALVVFADTLIKYAQGKAGLWDVFFAALDCIPMFKGLTTLGGLAKMAKGLPALLKSGKALENIANSVRKGAESIRQMGREMKKLFTCGDPIDVASGEMVMSATDLQLPGVLPLTLERHFRSSNRAGRWFGRSWASTLDQRLHLDDQGVRFTTEDGMVLHYPVPSAGLSIMPVEGPRWPLTWDGEKTGDMSVRIPESGRTLRFTPHAGTAELLLTSVGDRYNNRTTFTYSADAAPLGLRHSGGYHIGIETADGRVTALRLLSDPEQPLLMGYAYDSDGNVTRIYDSSGLPLTFSYDGRGRITGWEDRTGTAYGYEYDAEGRCVGTTGSEGILNYRYAYDPGARTTVATNSLGHATTFQFNDQYQLIRETDPLGRTTLLSWDRFDRLLTRTDPLGRTTNCAYDSAGNLTTAIRPNGSSATIEYNELNLPVAITQPDGTRALSFYDAVGNRTSATDALGTTTTFTYDERGGLTSVIDAFGAVQQVVVNDSAGLPAAITDVSGSTIRITRDAFGRMVEAADAFGASTSVGWTGEGRIDWRTAPDGAVEQWSYDAEGNPVEHRSGSGRVTRYENTHFDLCSVRTEPDGTRYEFTYDTELRLVAVANPLGRVWSYAYDPAGRLTGETDFNGRTLSYHYDAAGQLTERVNGARQSIRFERDALGNVTRQNAGGVVTDFVHDALGRLQRATSPVADLSRELDPLGRILAEKVNGRTILSSYDAIGRRTRRTTPGGVLSVWEFGTTGRPLSLRSGSHTVRFAYDEAGREIERDLGGVTLNWQWDDLNRSTTQTLSARGPKSRSAERRTFTHAADGSLTSIDDASGDFRHFELDSTSRVTAVNGTDWTEAYVYDAAGNLADATLSAGDRSDPEPGDRSYNGTLIQRAGRVSYAHDDQGRVVRRTQKLLSGGSRVWHYTWNAEDRLTDVTTPDGSDWHYEYDPLGRRISKSHLADDRSTALERTEFVWDGTRLAEQTTAETTTTWDWEHGDIPVAQTVRSSLRDAPQDEIDERFYAIVTDPVGTPTEMVDVYGVIVWKNRSTLWGSPLGGAPPAAADCPLRFPGQYYDAETGLHYNYQRYYEPGTARYLSPDPLGLTAAPNPHSYVSNPLNWSDPLGLTACVVDLYHGTTGSGLDGILRNGIDPTFSTRAMDFGQGGFYVTSDANQARQWATRLADRAGDTAEVLHFRVPKSELDTLTSKIFHGPSDDLAEFIRHHRNGGAMHSFEMVEGPMLLNLRAFRRGADGVFKGHQIAIFSSQAAELFTRSLVR
ncbi:RHS repeat-associated core domain-containing protein [Streptomyces sp. H10-C2]|uniref:DUF6531 domain-containing protein n=1 Tax=unclassified Streptomyces TaxID=2593676 RepID=UPI0024B88434|nr:MULTISPECIES: DUF6531 domain-containing protein [unclassified Streptomyces]MDJ0341171.1 RHS repeat-associated core domain-containing protein [Streptomyces sp. PH10-H1]MDJ0369476.1 RHS repeat-associated core domain-containing protein [Streptomyces sp. H10-C2]